MTQPRSGNGRPLPLVTPTSRPYFDAARQGRILMQHCPRDGYFFYPRSHCPRCLKADWEWRPARAGGRIHSYTIDRSGQDPGLREQAPFAIAVVDLDDGPRMVGNVVGCPFEAIRVGQRVVVYFEMVDDQPIACFRVEGPGA